MKFEIRGIWILVLAALFGAALVFFFSKGCGKAAPVVQAPDTDSARIANKIRQLLLDSTQTVIAEQLREKQRKIDSSQQKIATLEIERKQLFTLNKVYREQLDKYATVSDDDSMVPVHPSYVLYCDSVADNAGRIVDNYMMYREEVKTTQENLLNQLSLKDREITILSKAKKETDIQNAWLSKGIDEIAKKSKPRNIVYGGFVAQGSKINPITAAGLGLSFAHKKGQLYGLNALMQKDGELLFQFDLKFKFSFR